MSNNITTTDLSDFGYRELDMLQELLKAMVEQGLPKDFNDDEVVPMMNMNSGNVFLTNLDYQVAMMNGEDLEMFHVLPCTGIEGFTDDLKQKFEDGDIIEEEDVDYLHDCGIITDNEHEEFIQKNNAESDEQFNITQIKKGGDILFTDYGYVGKVTETNVSLEYLKEQVQGHIRGRIRLMFTEEKTDYNKSAQRILMLENN